MIQKGAEESDKQGQVIWEVNSMAPKTKNFEDLMEQTPRSVIEINRAVQEIHTLWSQANACKYMFGEITLKFWAGLHFNVFLMSSLSLRIEMTNRNLRFCTLSVC